MHQQVLNDDVPPIAAAPDFEPAPDVRLLAGYCPRHDLSDDAIQTALCRPSEVPNRRRLICLCIVPQTPTHFTLAALRKGKHTCDGSVTGALECKSCLTRKTTTIPENENVRMAATHSCNYGMRRAEVNGARYHYDVVRASNTCAACTARSKSVRARNFLPSYVPQAVDDATWADYQSLYMTPASVKDAMETTFSMQPQKDPTAKKVPPKPAKQPKSKAKPKPKPTKKPTAKSLTPAPSQKKVAPKTTVVAPVQSEPVAAIEAPAVEPAGVVVDAPKPAQTPKAPKPEKAPVPIPTADELTALEKAFSEVRKAHHAARTALNVARRAAGLPDYGSGVSRA